MIAAVPFYVAGAVSDWRTRTARNWLWGVVNWFALLDLLQGGFGRFAAAALFLVFGWSMYRWGQFGGADAKAVMASGAFFPDPVMAFSVLGVAALGCLVWGLLVEGKRMPFLIPLASAFGTYAVLGAFP